MTGNVFITGANGFLGLEAKKLFCMSGFNVYPLRNYTKFANIEEWKNYVNKSFEKTIPDLIVNIGSCQASGDSFDDICNLTNSNVIAPSYLASALISCNPSAQYITISTSWQYDENTNYRPFNLYAASKQALDDYLTHYALSGLKVTSLILFDTYSEFDSRKKIHNLIRDSVTTGDALGMTSGEQVINFTHVTDAAAAILQAYKNRLAAKFETNHVKWSIKSFDTIQVKQLLDYVHDKSKIKQIVLGERKYRPREIFKISSKFENVPGWVPVVDFENCIKSILNK